MNLKQKVGFVECFFFSITRPLPAQNMTNKTRIKVHAPDWVRTCDVECGRQKYPCRQAFLVVHVTLTTSTHVTGDKAPVSDLE